MATDVQIDYDSLNNELMNLDNAFTNNNTNYTNTNYDTNVINFPPINDVQSVIKTESMKKVSKSGDHRNEFNQRLNEINSANFFPIHNQQSQQPFTPVTEFIPYSTPSRNNNYQIQNQNSQNSNLQNSHQQRIQQQPTNGISNYYSLPPIIHNNNNNHHNAHQNNHHTSQQFPNQMPNQSPNNTNNLLNFQEQFVGGYNNSNKNLNNINQSFDNKMDLRQNMNSKLDSFIFNNPGNNFAPMIPIDHGVLFSNNAISGRINLQESSKDFYRNEANNRMMQYSPLSRAVYVPAAQDPYGNSGMMQPDNGFRNQGPTTKETISARMSQYTPLSRTIVLQQNGDSQQQQFPPNQQNTHSNVDYSVKMKEIQATAMQNMNLINRNLKNVVDTNMPINSNFNF